MGIKPNNKTKKSAKKDSSSTATTTTSSAVVATTTGSATTGSTTSWTPTATPTSSSSPHSLATSVPLTPPPPPKQRDDLLPLLTARGDEKGSNEAESEYQSKDAFTQMIWQAAGVMNGRPVQKSPEAKLLQELSRRTDTIYNPHLRVLTSQQGNRPKTSSSSSRFTVTTVPRPSTSLDGATRFNFDDDPTSPSPSPLLTTTAQGVTSTSTAQVGSPSFSAENAMTLTQPMENINLGQANRSRVFGPNSKKDDNGTPLVAVGIGSPLMREQQLFRHNRAIPPRDPIVQVKAAELEAVIAHHITRSQMQWQDDPFLNKEQSEQTSAREIQRQMTPMQLKHARGDFSFDLAWGGEEDDDDDDDGKIVKERKFNTDLSLEVTSEREEMGNSRIFNLESSSDDMRPPAIRVAEPEEDTEAGQRNLFFKAYKQLPEMGHMFLRGDSSVKLIKALERRQLEMEKPNNPAKSRFFTSQSGQLMTDDLGTISKWSSSHSKSCSQTPENRTPDPKLFPEWSEIIKSPNSASLKSSKNSRAARKRAQEREELHAEDAELLRAVRENPPKLIRSATLAQIRETDALRRVLRSREKAPTKVKTDVPLESRPMTAAKQAALQFVIACESKGLIPRPLILHTFDAKLQLSDFGIGDSEAHLLAQYLKALKQPLSLILKRNHIGPEGVKAIATVASVCQVKGLDLEGNPIRREGALEVVELIKNSHYLTNLNLSCCKLPDQCGCALAQAFASTKDDGVLSSLTLGTNSFGPATAAAISSAICKTRSLYDLNLSWNQIGASGATYLAEALSAANCMLRSLNLSWNGIGDEGAAAIAGSLATSNTGLERLDISHNRIHDEGCSIVAYGMRRNRCLTWLILDGNPVGRVGGGAVFRARTTLGGGARNVSLLGCSFSGDERICEMAEQPKGQYSLNLSVLRERAIANELYEWALREKGCNLRQMSISGRKIADISYDLSRPWVIPTSGVLVLTYVPTPKLSSEEEAMDSRAFAMLIAMLTLTEDSADKINVISMGTYHSKLSASQGKRLLSQVNDENVTAEVIAVILPKIVDLENFVDATLGMLSATQARAIEGRLGSNFGFNPSKPTGHYIIDLSSPMDSVLAQRLAKLALRQSQILLQAGHPTTTHNGEKEQFRWPMLSGQVFKFRNREGWEPPKNGILEFHYVSLINIAMVPKFLGKAVLGSMCDIVRDLGNCRGQQVAHDKMQELVLTLKDRVMLCSQLAQLICEAPSDNEFASRVDIIQRLYDYVDDSCINFHHVRRILTPTEHAEVAYRLGWLNLFNPEQPDGVYQFELSQWDARMVLQMLLTLNSNESGECITDVRFNLETFDIPKTWSINIPKQGQVALTFTTQNPKAILRTSLSLRCGCNARDNLRKVRKAATKWLAKLRRKQAYKRNSNIPAATSTTANLFDEEVVLNTRYQKQQHKHNRSSSIAAANGNNDDSGLDAGNDDEDLAPRQEESLDFLKVMRTKLEQSKRRFQ